MSHRSNRCPCRAGRPFCQELLPRTGGPSDRQGKQKDRREISPVLAPLVGARGFEPPTSCSQGRRANQAALRPGVSAGCQPLGTEFTTIPASKMQHNLEKLPACRTWGWTTVCCSIDGNTIHTLPIQLLPDLPNCSEPRSGVHLGSTYQTIIPRRHQTMEQPSLKHSR